MNDTGSETNGIGASMFCNACGERLDDNENFCPKCGAKTAPRENEEEPSRVVLSSPVSGNDSPNLSAQVVTQQAEGGQRGRKGRLISVLGAIALVVIAVVARTAASNYYETLSDEVNTAETERVIREGIQSEFDSLTDGSRDSEIRLLATINEAFRELSSIVDIDELYSAILEGFDARIDSVNVTKNDGTVHLTISHKDMSGALDGIVAEFEEGVSTGDIPDTISESEIRAWYGDKLLAKISEAPIVETPCKISVHKQGNYWSIAEDSLTSEFFSQLFWGEVSATSE